MRREHPRLYYEEYSDAFLSAATCTSFVLMETKCIHLLCFENDDFLLCRIHSSSFSHIFIFHCFFGLALTFFFAFAFVYYFVFGSLMPLHEASPFAVFFLHLHLFLLSTQTLPR